MEDSLALLESINESGAMTQALAWRELKKAVAKLAEESDHNLSTFGRMAIKTMDIVWTQCAEHHAEIDARVKP